MVKDFTITVFYPRHNQKVFWSGETVSGQLHFTLTESKCYKYIGIGLYGEAYVKWTEESGDDSETYESNEVYVNEFKTLWSRDETPHGKIGPGTFDLPFQFVLPPNCLGTFHEKVGSISYALHGLIKTGLPLHRDHRIKVPLQVSRIADINLPQLLVPIYESRSKQVGFFCFGSDLEFTVSLERTGFCVGHNLPLTVDVVNSSSRRIKIRANIVRYCYYYGEGDPRHNELELASLMTHNTSRGRTKRTKRQLSSAITHEIAHQLTFAIDDLIVPLVEPSFDDSPIIKVYDCLKVTAVIPWAKNCSVKIPITLGNVPLNR